MTANDLHSVCIPVQAETPQYKSQKNTKLIVRATITLAVLMLAAVVVVVLMNKKDSDQTPELPPQELYFAATLEREGETFANARFNLDSSILWREVDDKQEIVKDAEQFIFDESTCTERIAWRLNNFLEHLQLPSEGFTIVDTDVIGGVSCDRYVYLNSWKDNVTNCITDDGFVLELCEDSFWTTPGQECSYLTNHVIIESIDPKFIVPDHC
ncbi:hypothetical protein GEMRC1_011469 [Eukaryota sp. GEM-RC1]